MSSTRPKWIHWFVAAGVLAFAVRSYGAASSVATYGTETPGTNGAPEIWVNGTPYVGNASFTLRLEHALNGSAAFLLIGTQPFDLFSSGFHINVLPFFVSPPLPTGGGNLVLPLPIPANPLFQGFDVYFQWAVNDPGAVAGVAATKGLRATLTDAPLVVGCGTVGATADPIVFVDPSTGTTGQWASTADNPSDIQFTPDGTMAVISSALTNSFVIVDAALGGTKVGEVFVGGNPNAAAITPDGARAYGVTYGSPTLTSEIVEIDIDPHSSTFATIVGSVAVPAGLTQLEGVSISADGKTLVTSNLGLAQSAWILAVDIDPQSATFHQVKQSIQGSGLWPDVETNADGTLAYVCHGYVGGGGELFIYSLLTGQFVGFAFGLGDFPTDIDLGPRGRSVWIAMRNSGTIVRVNVDPSDPQYLTTVTSNVTMAKPFALAITADGADVYTIEQGGSLIHRLDAQTLTWTQSFTVATTVGDGIAVR